MELNNQQAQQRLAALLPGEQTRLLRLCTAIIDDPIAAEDLVQQTFIEAWRQAHKIYDWQGYQPWLSAIARHICQRWLRQQGRESRISPLSSTPDDFMVGAYDLEVELERSELIELLDRALALLPSDTRAVLLERYVAESSYAEMAVNLGISEALVGVRLHRGKLALQRLLTSDLSDEAAVYGLVKTITDEWQETRIWCPFCGRQKLRTFLNRENSDAIFRCPACNRGSKMTIVYTNQAELIAGVKSPKARLSRQINFLHHTYRQALMGTATFCATCGQSARIHHQLSERCLIDLDHQIGIFIECPQCGSVSDAPLQHLVLDLPLTQRFWRAYPRMRVLPEQKVNVNGRPAMLTIYESVTYSAQLQVITAIDTLEVLNTRVIGDNHLTES